MIIDYNSRCCIATIAEFHRFSEVQAEAAHEALSRMPGLEIHAEAAGKIIVTLETDTESEIVARLDELQRLFNNGQPERLGSEQNYQRYLDRVESMKAEIARKESDIAAIKRELAKLPAS